MRFLAFVAVAALLGSAAAVVVPQAARGTSHAFEFDDAAGDVRPNLGFQDGDPFFGGAPGMPGNAFADVLDIVRVFVGEENETHVTVGMQLNGMDATGRDLASQLFSLQYELFFRTSYDPDRTWDVSFDERSFLVFSNGVATSGYDLCWESDSDGDCSFVPSGMSLDATTATLRFAIPRLELAVDDEAGYRAARAGDAIEGLRARSFGLLWGDYAPDLDEAEGGFEFQTASANDRLRLVWQSDLEEREEPDEFEFQFGPPRADAYGVTPGVPATFPLHVINDQPSKKVVNLTAEVEALDPEAWNVTVAPTIVVPANDRVVLSVIVNPSAEVTHREFAKLLVRGTVLGDKDVLGLAETRLMGVVTPTKDNNVLHLHTWQEFGCFGGALAALDDACREVAPFGWQLMNTLDTDPLYEDKPVPVLGFEGGRNALVFEMDTPLGADLRFDLAEGVIAVDASFTARVATTIEVNAFLFAGGKVVGSGEGTGAIAATPTPVHIEFAPLLRENTLNATEGELQLRLEVQDTRLSGIPLGDIQIGGIQFAASNVFLDVAGSSLTLPLLALPPRTLTVSTGEHLVSMALKGGRDPEEYVNPGRGLLFNFTVLNEGVLPDTIRMKVNATTPPGWSVQLLPSGKFSLDPGEPANATLVVRAPLAAQEADRAVLELIATSSGDPAVQATMKLVVLVTKGIDIPDENLGPTIKPKSKKKDSPVASPLLALMVVAALLVACRRRTE